MSSGVNWGGTYSRHPHGFWTAAAVLEAGRAAGQLLLEMSDYADVHHTDGVISERQAQLMGAPNVRRKSLDRLTKVGLLIPIDVPKGYVIAGWTDGHRTAEQWEKVRRQKAEAGRKGGQAKRPPAPDPDPDREHDAKHDASGVVEPQQLQHSTPQRSEAAATAAVSTTLDLLKVGQNSPAGQAVAELIGHAIDQGWPSRAVARLALEAATKDHPVGWFLATLERRDPPAEAIEA